MEFCRKRVGHTTWVNFWRRCLANYAYARSPRPARVASADTGNLHRVCITRWARRVTGIMASVTREHLSESSCMVTKVRPHAAVGKFPSVGQRLFSYEQKSQTTPRANCSTPYRLSSEVARLPRPVGHCGHDKPAETSPSPRRPQGSEARRAHRSEAGAPSERRTGTGPSSHSAGPATKTAIRPITLIAIPSLVIRHQFHSA
jgi:hypothetical protein